MELLDARSEPSPGLNGSHPPHDGEPDTGKPAAPDRLGDYSWAYGSPIAQWVWREKYRRTAADGSSSEASPEASLRRVADALLAKDPGWRLNKGTNDLGPIRSTVPPRLLNMTFPAALKEALLSRELLPAGRIQAGAGTDKRVTLLNCFVNVRLDDSLPGIMEGLRACALSMQQGGGVGTDFSTLRPNGAIVHATASESTGPLPYMRVFDANCRTIMSAGTRRGAMMATLADWHADLPEFIDAKRTAGELTQFNLSILVSDAFMTAVERDGDWDLGFGVPRADGQHVAELEHHFSMDHGLCGARERDGNRFYVYRRVRARELWNRIMRATYEHAEPGVIFIDRINARNNLRYAEHLHGTNPCGEQPLPPHGVCDLASVNLAVLVWHPFTPEAMLDVDRLRELTWIGVRALDNVLDLTLYPLEEQRAESMAKRRIGLGITGLGNALQMMRLRYGSPEAVRWTNDVLCALRDATYAASVALAKERGAFPVFDAEKYLAGENVKALPEPIREGIRVHGIRNGVLQTIAPNGTISLYAGNLSSGLEPTFSFKPYQRKVLRPDGSHEAIEVKDFGYQVYERVHGPTAPQDLPDYMVGALDLTPAEHLAMQAVCQRHIDASVSKTINCPADMPFEAFERIYRDAYVQGCKGCTTYRPSETRGAVLVETPAVKPTAAPVAAATHAPMKRPEFLDGRTYKVKWPAIDAAFYITVNHWVDDQGAKHPREVFIVSKAPGLGATMKAIGLTTTAVFRRGGDVGFIVEELCSVYEDTGGAWVDGRYCPSVIALWGWTIEKELVRIGAMKSKEVATKVATNIPENITAAAGTDSAAAYAVCPRCSMKAVLHQEGCDQCLECGYSSCG